MLQVVSVNVLEDAGDFAPSVETKQIWLDSGKAVELFDFCIVVIGELESAGEISRFWLRFFCRNFRSISGTSGCVIKLGG